MSRRTQGPCGPFQLREGHVCFLSVTLHLNLWSLFTPQFLTRSTFLFCLKPLNPSSLLSYAPCPPPPPLHCALPSPLSTVYLQCSIQRTLEMPNEALARRGKHFLHLRVSEASHTSSSVPPQGFSGPRSAPPLHPGAASRFFSADCDQSDLRVQVFTVLERTASQQNTMTYIM